MTHIDKNRVTGLVLAGGRGSRMGGVDKGLQPLDGKPLAQHALERLAPQVGRIMLNANRNLDAYARFAVPVWPDADAEFAGPLAGMLAGMLHCETDWLATVPCDSPRFPLDLVERLARELGSAAAAVAVTIEGGRAHRQPVFCLVQVALAADLASYLQHGGRKVDPWLDRHHAAAVPFPLAEAFFNANTLDELRRLGRTAV